MYAENFQIVIVDPNYSLVLSGRNLLIAPSWRDIILPIQDKRILSVHIQAVVR